VTAALLVLVLASDPVPSGLSSAEVAARAEAAFNEGVARKDAAETARPHFHEAARLFDELRRRGASNPDLYRNLGNSQLLAGDLPGAILSYRRGLRLAPADRALRANLAGARELISYPSLGALGRQPPDERPPWLPRVRGDWYLRGAILCYALAWIGFTRWLMTRRGALLGLAAGALALAAVLTLLVVGAAREADADTAYPLVVIADDGVLVRKGDSLAFPPRYDAPVNRGVEARRLFIRGDWLQIELAGGEVGWVRRDWVLLDEE
jgi:hypothetical protein